ncbi:cell envelope biogenesis protein OmpA [Mesonia maritima]|uniref:cell envelope biogenesis protein OmpA n=1 Tax=Mesonia maritima TaxID=1793873 RepID=UPI00362765B7
MKKISILVILLISVLTACVPAKKFNELEQQYKQLEQQNEQIASKANNCEEKLEEINASSTEISREFQEQNREKELLESKIAQIEESYEKLQQSYDALEDKSSSTLLENSKRNRMLIEELEEKQNLLRNERKELAERSSRIKELENMIAAKEEKMQTLKNSVSAALTNFEGKGLTVERRNGKVYVSMENKLLFDSGSWAVGSQGKQAVKQLGLVLAQTQISVF